MSLQRFVRHWLTREFERRGFVVTRRPEHPSETSKHRAELAPFCAGYGCDIGFGGDPVLDSSIRVDLPQPYTSVGAGTVQLGGDCGDLRWFRDEVLDYIYSSHVIEDFDEPRIHTILREWARVLRPGGRLVLLQPDQQRYLAACRRKGEPPNPHHCLEDFSLAFVRRIFGKLGGFRELQAFPNLGEYSFALVSEKTGE